MKKLLLASVVGVALSGCAAKDGTAAAVNSPWLAPSTGQQNAASGSSIERYFPLADGMVYTYQTENEVGERGILVARVHRLDATHGELRFPNGAKRFELAPDGVRLEARGGEVTYVLKMPLVTGTSWRGEHGGQSRILGTMESIDAPSGHYDNCIQTLEERGGDRPVRFSTVFCPDIGVVQIEAASGANLERAQLKTYAPPLRMREDGTEKLPVGTPDIPP